MVVLVEPPASTQRFGMAFQALVTLLQDASCQADGTGVPSGFGGGLAAWLDASGLECLKHSLGFGMPCVPLEAGPKTHTQHWFFIESWPFSSC